MEKKFDLLFEVKPTLSGQFLVKPKDDESIWVLSSIKEIDGQPLHIVQKEAASLQKGVVCGFPQEFGLCLLSRLDNICMLAHADEVQGRSRDQEALCVF